MRNICLVLIIGLTNIVYAKNSYHISDLVSMVIKNHPSIKMQEYMIRGADAQVESAKWNYFPTVSFSANQGVNKDKLWDGTAVVSQPIWTGGKLDASYDMAIANRDNSKSGLGESGYTLVDTLFNSLKTYLQTKGNIKALTEGQDQLNILKNMLARRIKAGVSSRSDMELLKARLFQMQTDINYAKASMQASLSQIELLTNHDFKGVLEVDNKISFDFDSLDSLIKSMMKTHPTLKKYDALIDYAKAEKSNAKAVLMPNVSLKVERGVGSNDYYYNDSTGETRVYVSVDASFGAGLSAVSGIEQAEAKIMQLKQEKLSTQQDLINKIMLAYNDYISSSNRVQSQSGSISSSEKVFESYTRLFLAGKRQWMDLVNTSRELTQNKMAFADTESTLLVSAYQLLLLSGKSDLKKMIPEQKTKQTTPSEDTDKLFIPSMDIIADAAQQKESPKRSKQAHAAQSGMTKRVVRTERMRPKTLKAEGLKDLNAAMEREAAQEKAEKIRLAKEKAAAEKARVAKEKAERIRVAKENAAKAKAEKAAKERAEKERLAQEKAEKIRLAKEKAAAEKARVAKEKAERIRVAKENAAKAKAEKAAKERAEKERLAQEKAEKIRLAKEKAAAEKARVAKEKAERIRVAKENAAKAKAEKAAKERAEKERLAQERAEKERLAQEKAEKIRLAKEKAAAEKARVAKETASKEKAETQQRESAHPKYYVQFDIELNEEMKHQLKKHHLKILRTKDGRYLIGEYNRAVDALAATREVKQIIHDEAYIVRQ
ncbi:TolC family protein [Sulfurovum mangrovi]|uniref:TolC family protein n=1 Tax=Sulfurovum mangrovi TaxID=2893889 RepID=UPI001E61225E|nr:TolC family protein [Sulfurovum mangrovi]UFH58897.1 TolC family protein [Sulfurovum mangrovi]